MEWLREFTHRVLQITHGRTTAFFIAFFIAGHAMVLLHRLTPVYVEYMMGLGGLVLGHSIKEDLMAAKNGPRPLGGPDGVDDKG